ncbi:MAG: potassium channel family protein [Cellvibrionaceae bacterium]
MQNILKLFGLAGLDASENPRAKLCYQMLEWPMMVAGLWLVALWYQGLSSPEAFANEHLEMALWSMFVIETGVLSLLVDNRARYLKNNWMNVAIIIIGFPIFLGLQTYSGVMRLVRILILLDLSIHMGSSLQRLLSQNSLGPTFAGSAIVIFMAGFMIAGIDPAFKSASEGIWWAWVTVTTVGYGDLVPATNLGRVFAGILILVGLGLISLLTASIATMNMEKVEARHQQAQAPESNSAKIERLEAQLSRIESKLDHLMKNDTTNPQSGANSQ